MRSLGSRSARPSGRRLVFEPLESRQLLTASVQYEAYLKAEIDYESTQVYTPAWISQQLSNHSNTASSNGNHVAIATLAADEALLCQRNPTAYASYGTSRT